MLKLLIFLGRGIPDRGLMSNKLLGFAVVSCFGVFTSVRMIYSIFWDAF